MNAAPSSSPSSSTHKRIDRGLTWFVFFCIIAAGLFAVGNTALSQVKSPLHQTTSATKDDKLLQSPDITTTSPSLAESALTVLDGPLDPNQYIVGPSDVFYVAVWGPVPVAFTVPVTPEGSLILPTIGTVDVQYQSLTETKRIVEKKLRESYRIGTISVSLLRPRKLSVTLRGAVTHPGQYIASSSDRVERVIRMGSELRITQPSLSIPLTTGNNRDVEYQIPSIRGLGQLSEKTSTRHILVIRKSGDTARVDIPKYYITGESRYNPYLSDGDIIYIPQKDVTRHAISVHGGVNSPGTFEFVPGDRLSDALQFADGLRTDNTSGQVVISRDNGATRLSLNLAAGENPELRSGDRILVDPSSISKENNSVTINGEVIAPGTYPIVVGETRLSEIVSAAGGLSDRALLTGSSVFRRRELIGERTDPYLEMQEILRTYPIVPADSVFFFLNSKVGIDPINVNFAKLFSEKDMSQDVVLQDGDYIFIAQDRNMVLVQGQVRFPGYLPVQRGASIEYYITQAGGFTEYADDSGVRIIKRATQSWLEPEDAAIESGDIIWIPKEPVHDFAYYLSIVRDIGTLLGSMVTIGLIIVQIEQISKNN